MEDSKEQLLALVRQALAMADRMGELDAGIALDRAMILLAAPAILFDVERKILKLDDRD
jgi:hypothetical protein